MIHFMENYGFESNLYFLRKYSPGLLLHNAYSIQLTFKVGHWCMTSTMHMARRPKCDPAGPTSAL